MTTAIEAARQARDQALAQSIRNALDDARGNKAEAARALGMNCTSLYKAMKRLGLRVEVEIAVRDRNDPKP